MGNAKPISTQDDGPAHERFAIQSDLSKWTIVFIGFSLVICTALFGQIVWTKYISTNDGVVLAICVAIGILWYFAKARKQGPVSRRRLFWICALWIASLLFLSRGQLVDSPFCIGCSGCTLVASLGLVCVRGESLMASISLGAKLLLLLLIEPLVRHGYPELLNEVTATFTSRLADFCGQTNVQVGERILFGHFAVDKIECIGTWDGVLSYFGIALFCILGFCRGRIAAVIIIFGSLLIWPLTQSFALVISTLLPIESNAIGESSLLWQLGLLSVGVMTILSLDQFVSTIFKPIPHSWLPAEVPILAVLWNRLSERPRSVSKNRNRSKQSSRHASVSRKGRSDSKVWSSRNPSILQSIKRAWRPQIAICSLLETARSWRHSRNWKRLLIHAPTILVLMVGYAAIFGSMLRHDEGRLARMIQTSERVCSTKDLESVCSFLIEEQFSKAIGGSMSLPSVQNLQVISVNNRQFIASLSDRILTLDPTNQVSRYRLGLVLCLSNRNDDAANEMKQALKRNLADIPKASEWIAKHQLVQQARGKTISEAELQRHLRIASKLSDCDFRLLFLFSSLLENTGQTAQAVEVAKRGVDLNPATILDLVRLYSRIGDERSLNTTASKAEKYFVRRLLNDDSEANRLAVADARVFLGRLADAVEILRDGLRTGIGGHHSNRQLSEIQRTLYLQSIRTNASGEVEVDLGLLETAADSDSTNPSLSSEIAKLMSISKKPSKKLLDAMQQQIASGGASVTCHLLLGEKYFELKRFQSASEHWEMALKKEPNNVVAMNNLAICLGKISPSNNDRAIQLVSRAANLAPNNADVFDTWGDVLLEANLSKDAINKYERAVGIDSKRNDIRKKLVGAYKRMGLNEMAQTQLRIVKSKEP